MPDRATGATGRGTLRVNPLDASAKIEAAYRSYLRTTFSPREPAWRNAFLSGPPPARRRCREIGAGINKNDGLGRHPGAITVLTARGGLLVLLVLLVLLLAGQAGLLRAGRNAHSVGPSDSVPCHPN